ncbi:MAG: VanZ family protein [Desulfobacterales bacterium]|nr:MAG: VanZ family protein [Desulfobacterales bacterium]UCD90687.1 MAG: VanZ family protein [Desulfobacterales bacterium]
MAQNKKTDLQRIMLWTLVAAYTIALPHAIIIYRSIEKHFSTYVAGKVPLVIIILLGIAYLASSVLLKRGTGYVLFLIPSTLIVYAIIVLEPNPNKHIHIPEYIILCWMLYQALVLDYKGKGIFLLVFICAIMLGIFDEIEQGIYPGRFYGSEDMVINTASCIIGILTLIGLRPGPSGDWSWVGCLKKYKASLAAIIFGLTGSAVTCAYLFHVQAMMDFWETYPLWLSGWNVIFLVLGSTIIISFWQCHHMQDRLKDQKESNPSDMEATARLWVLSPMVILLVIHALVVFVGVSGLSFD